MNYRIKSLTLGPLLALCGLAAGPSTAVAQANGLAEIYLLGESVYVDPRVPFELAITISGPDDLLVEEALSSDGTVYDVKNLTDGYYNYEIKIKSMGISQNTSKGTTKGRKVSQKGGIDQNGRAVGAASAVQDAVNQKKGSAKASFPVQQSGGFRVLNGVVLDPSERE